MKVEDVMSRDVVSVGEGTSLKDVAAVLVQHEISGVPVCDTDGAVVGVVTEVDILWKELAQRLASGLFGWILAKVDREDTRINAQTAGEAMTSPAITITPATTIVEAARVMIEQHVNTLPVVVDGLVVGIVTRRDLVRVFARSDRELEHEIRHGATETTSRRS
jgi:CBS domain-containing protein